MRLTRNSPHARAIGKEKLRILPIVVSVERNIAVPLTYKTRELKNSFADFRGAAAEMEPES